MANLCIKTPSSATCVLIFQLLVLRPRPSEHWGNGIGVWVGCLGIMYIYPQNINLNLFLIAFYRAFFVGSIPLIYLWYMYASGFCFTIGEDISSCTHTHTHLFLTQIKLWVSEPSNVTSYFLFFYRSWKVNAASRDDTLYCGSIYLRPNSARARVFDIYDR